MQIHIIEKLPPSGLLTRCPSSAGLRSSCESHVVLHRTKSTARVDVPSSIRIARRRSTCKHRRRTSTIFGHGQQDSPAEEQERSALATARSGDSDSSVSISGRFTRYLNGNRRCLADRQPRLGRPSRRVVERNGLSSASEAAPVPIQI